MKWILLGPLSPWSASGVSNPYPHFFIEEFLVPKLLDGDAVAGDMLEALLQSRDSDLSEAALISVLEMLGDEPQ